MILIHRLFLFYVLVLFTCERTSAVSILYTQFILHKNSIARLICTLINLHITLPFTWLTNPSGFSDFKGKSLAVTFKSWSLTAQSLFSYQSTGFWIHTLPFSTSGLHSFSPVSLIESRHLKQVPLCTYWQRTHIFQGSLIATATLENSLALSPKVEHMRTRWSSNSTHYIQHMYQEILTSMFIAALIVIALN